MEKLNGGCGIFTWYGFVMPFEENLDKIKKAGFSSVCLWWGDEFEQLNGKHIFAPEKCYAAGLTPENAHIPYYGCDELWYDKLDGEALEEKYLGGINEARLCGIDTLVIHPFEMKLPIAKRKIDKGYSRFLRLGETARKNGVKLAIENIRDNTPLYELIKYLNDETCGLCYDSGHDNVSCGDDELSFSEDGLYDPSERFGIIKPFKDKLYALHMHDNDATADQHLLPGEGNIDFEALRDILISADYKRSFMLESSYPFVYDEETGYGAERNEELTTEEYLTKAYEAAQIAAGYAEKNKTEDEENEEDR